MSKVYQQLLERLGENAPQPRLEPVLEAVGYLGDPHKCAPVIHITGTNGKTSVSRMTASLLESQGMRTGLLTSPHLQDFTERIQIGLQPIDEESLERSWEDIQFQLQVVDERLMSQAQPRLTFFECLVILAFACFADAPVDVMVLEVGMGGEWDATNVADAAVAVFTPIDLDHTSRLGGTAAEIARTKAGIIKPGSLAVSAAQTDEVLECLQAACPEPLAVFGKDFNADSHPAVGGQLVSFQGLSGEYPEVFLPLFGTYQAHNAALALAAVETFFNRMPMNEAVITEGFAAATSPGRLQLAAKHPTVLLDAAHNPHGARHLAAAFKEFFLFPRTICMLGFFADKDVAGIITELSQLADQYVITAADNLRAAPAPEVYEIARQIIPEDRLILRENLAEALEYSRAAAGEDGAVVVTGSITLLGEVMDQLS